MPFPKKNRKSPSREIPSLQSTLVLNWSTSDQVTCLKAWPNVFRTRDGPKPSITIMWHQVHHFLAFIGKKLLRTSSGKWCHFPFLPKWFAGTKPLSILHFDSISEKAAGHRQAVFSWRKCIQRKQRTLERRTNLINLVALPTIPQCWCCWGLFHEILPYQRLGKTQMQPIRYMASLAPGNGSISGLCKSRFTFRFRGFLWILASRINQTVGIELRFSKIPLQSVPTSRSWITLNLSILKKNWNSPNLPNSSKVGWSYLFKSEQLDEKYLPYSLKCQDPSCLLRAWRNGCNFFILILLFAPVFSFCFHFPATHTKSMMQSKSSTHHQQETPPLQPPQNPQSLDLLLCTGLSLIKRCLAML